MRCTVRNLSRFPLYFLSHLSSAADFYAYVCEDSAFKNLWICWISTCSPSGVGVVTADSSNYATVRLELTWSLLH